MPQSHTLPTVVYYRKIQCFKQEDRLETEGMPVPVSDPSDPCNYNGRTTRSITSPIFAIEFENRDTGSFMHMYI